MEDRDKRLRELEGQLTPRHLKFARLVAEGDRSLKDAYSETYPNASEATCLTNGARLLGKARVSEYVELLSGEAADTFVVNKHQVMERLWEVAGLNLDSDSKAANAVASALKTLLDHLAPKATKSKVEVTGKDGGPIGTANVNLGGGGLSDEMTRAIITQTLGLTDEAADRFMGIKAEETNNADATEGR